MIKLLTLKHRIIVSLGVVLLLTSALIVLNVITLNERKNTPTMWTYLSMGNAITAMLEASVRETVSPIVEIRQNALRELPTLISAIESRSNVLLEGSETIRPIQDSIIRSDIENSMRNWRDNVLPLIARIRDSPESTEVPVLLENLSSALDLIRTNVSSNVERQQLLMSDEIDESIRNQYIFITIVAFLLVVFATVLRRVLTAVEETIMELNETSTELASGIAQQTSSAQEQAAAINQVVSTVDEVQQTSAQSVDRAKELASSSKLALETGQSGLSSVEESVERITQVQGITETIGKEILALAESAQAIGEIIAAVNDITEQTNILALNAGIEAAKAGEQGAGFTVVAREIKNLASQSKQETVRVRKILTDIQKATNNVVMVTEEGSKAVTETVRSVISAGDTIKSLVKTIRDASTSANQIAASTQQQSNGMNQIQQAIKEINEAVNQTTTASRQVEKVATDLRTRGEELKVILHIS